MSLLIAIIVLLLLGLVVLVVGGPLRAERARERVGSTLDEGAGGGGTGAAAVARRHELEAAREAKYREIRDAELDFRTGKLSREDFEAINAELRAEAISILDRLERAGEPGEEPA